MRRNIEFKDFEPNEHIKKLLDRFTSKVEKNVSTFPPDLVHLRLLLERNAARSLYDTSITLDLPGKTLAAKEEQHDVEAGIKGAFEDLERQLKKYKETLRGEHWKRPARRREVREMKSQAASSVSQEDKRVSSDKRLMNQATEATLVVRSKPKRGR